MATFSGWVDRMFCLWEGALIQLGGGGGLILNMMRSSQDEVGL